MQTIKPISGSKGARYTIRKPVSNAGVGIPTALILAFCGFFGAIAVSWVLGNNHVTELFIQLHIGQQNPPAWLQPPQVTNKYYLFLPTVILFSLGQIIIKLSPEPTTWSRRIVATILLTLFIRYFMWRSLTTLNLANPVDGIVSILLFLMELLAMVGGALQLLLLFSVKNRDIEADRYAALAKENNYNPTVDILIPTYNEPDFILKRTIMGCQALNYQAKEIYVLDDTKRQSIQQLAQELGCHYITRPDNLHAKAGNLNNALKQTHGELVVVFDADFIPTSNFLERTIGFFQKEKIALVQTPQSFYNYDPIAHNLGLENVLTSEEEVFYRHLQPLKDGVGSVVCAGTSFIARRKALEAINYFVTESLCEDYFTGIKLAAQGYELVYLDEKLSAGLAAESIGAHIEQRLRWARGTLQALFIKSNPLTIAGLNIWQRLGHLDGLLHWFTCIARVFFLFFPLLCIFAQLNPIESNLGELIYMFLPYYAMQIALFTWINKRSRSILLSDVYCLVQTIPIFMTVVKVMFNPFGKGFQVTPKGVARDKFNYNWSLALPMAFIFSATLISFSYGLLNSSNGNLNLSLYWSGYNLLTIAVAMITLLDLPKPSFYEWFKVRKEVNIYSEQAAYQGVAQQLSEEGIDIIIEDTANLATEVTVEILPELLIVSGRVTRSYVQDDAVRAIIKFQNLSTEQHRELVEMLYCRPGQWRRRNSPSELQSIFILFKLLLRPLMFLNRKKVSQLKLQY
ncbi:cellulose synthase (UDP-forming) [Chondrocystis sp. NIES-4102]|nr:cellulose synthase (UDP-forming) [Chondrocystis sp. NIES-4102]